MIVVCAIRECLRQADLRQASIFKLNARDLHDVEICKFIYIYILPWSERVNVVKKKIFAVRAIGLMLFFSKFMKLEGTGSLQSSKDGAYINVRRMQNLRNEP